MPTDGVATLAIPLVPWVDRKLGALAEAARCEQIARLSGTGLLVERAVLNGFRVPGMISAGGGCRLIPVRTGWIALNLARPDDRELLPALFGEFIDPADDSAILTAASRADGAHLAARGREMGLAIASSEETTVRPPVEVLTQGTTADRAPTKSPLIVDMSALWAGPLCSHLLQMTGGRVVKVESRSRPDAMRHGDHALFALLNGDKDSLVLDFGIAEDLAALTRLLCRADIVIEAARPRALLQLGIDADALVRKSPGLTWITITGHGARGQAAGWVGFGDDCGVTGGLSHALHRASGRIGFVGDAIADPLTGVIAALEAWCCHAQGGGRRIGIAMSGVVSQALHDEALHDAPALDASLRRWSAAQGQPFPTMPTRAAGVLRGWGADTEKWRAASC